MASAQFELTGKRVWIAGHRGMVGSALTRRFAKENCQLLLVEREQLDLRRQQAVEEWVGINSPEVVVIAAAKVGGIGANMRDPAPFLYDNLAIALNIVKTSQEAGVQKLLFLGSSCIYPRDATQPLREETLISGPLEPTNEWYAISKITGIKLCQAFRRQFGCDFISAIPTNLYGPGDNFDPEVSHVPAALLRRFHEANLSNAPEAIVWGTGKPRREFMHVDDMADACVFLLQHYSSEVPINIGTGREITIAELAHLIAGVVSFDGRLVFDESQPDGMPRKLLDITRMRRMGWSPSIDLQEGLSSYYAWFLDSGLASDEHHDLNRGAITKAGGEE